MENNNNKRAHDDEEKTEQYVWFVGDYDDDAALGMVSLGCAKTMDGMMEQIKKDLRYIVFRSVDKMRTDCFRPLPPNDMYAGTVIDTEKFTFEHLRMLNHRDVLKVCVRLGSDFLIGGINTETSKNHEKYTWGLYYPDELAEDDWIKVDRNMVYLKFADAAREFTKLLKTPVGFDTNMKADEMMEWFHKTLEMVSTKFPAIYQSVEFQNLKDKHTQAIMEAMGQRETVRVKRLKM